LANQNNGAASQRPMVRNQPVSYIPPKWGTKKERR
jgi:hypothetical protein